MKGIEKNAAAFTIERAHAAEVAREMAFGDELGEHGLMEMRRADVHGVAHGEKGIDEIGGKDKIADSQRGEEHFAESADINNARGVIESLQGSDGLALEAIFAVIVIFDDPSAGLPRPLQKLQAPRSTHGNAERILMRRRN